MNPLDMYMGMLNRTPDFETLVIDDRTRIAMGAMMICMGILLIWIGYTKYKEQHPKNKIQDEIRMLDEEQKKKK